MASGAAIFLVVVVLLAGCAREAGIYGTDGTYEKQDRWAGVFAEGMSDRERAEWIAAIEEEER